MPDTETLSPKEMIFVREYLIDANGTRAAIAAGYAEKSAHVASSRLLKKDKIQAALSAQAAKIAKKLDITAEKVLAEYARIGFSDIRKAVWWKSDILTYAADPDGNANSETGEDRGEPIYTSTVRLTNSEDLEPEMAACISEVKQDSKGGLSIKLHDKLGALNTLAKHLGILKEPEVKVTITYADRLKAAKERLRERNGRREQPAVH
jgi:phage terminase small subunit